MALVERKVEVNSNPGVTVHRVENDYCQSEFPSVFRRCKILNVSLYFST
jgi:hypothetical protein